MRVRFVSLVVILCALVGALTVAAQSNSPELQLEAARKKAVIDGDHDTAVRDYQAIADRYRTTEPGIAATALLSLAEAFESVADVRAAAVYTRLVAEHPTRVEARTARARLGTVGSEPVQVKGDRTVWSARDADGFGTISPDGRFLTYTDWTNGAALALRDLTLGVSYRLTTGGSTQFSAIARDGKQVVYEWYPETTVRPRPSELRVGTLTATGMQDSRLLFKNDEVRVAPYDWSPDGNWIAVSALRTDGTNQIGLVSVRDGLLRVLKSVDWKSPTKMFFSPDGRYVAYDLQANDDGNERHVFVMAVDGTLETPVVAHASQNSIMGWSPDGQLVVFSSDRSGSVGLWALSVKDGKATAGPTLLKPDIASAWSLGLTAAGTMYVWKYASPIYVQASSIDLAAGTLAAAPVFQRFITSRGRPAWSADGRSLAFQSCAPLGAGPCTLWIRSMETGQLRELTPKLGYFAFMSWSPDGRQLLTQGRDARGRTFGLYRIDVQTGDATLVPLTSPSNASQWSADSKHVYYRRQASIIERDLTSGAEREVVRIPTPDAGRFAMAPDGRTVAYLARGQSESHQLFVLPVSGGTPRSLFQVSAPYSVDSKFQWTSDGRSIAVVKDKDGTPAELWIVDVDGGQSRKLDVSLDHWLIQDGYAIDQAGRQIAFVANAGQPGLEIRALENFLPAAATPR